MSDARLIESELFGHVKGAFTGAHSDRAGAFERASGSLGEESQPEMAPAPAPQGTRTVSSELALPFKEAKERLIEGF